MLKKILRWLIGAPVFMGTMAMIGIFAVIGLFELDATWLESIPFLWQAGLVFFAAGVIEIQVFGENIVQGLEQILDPESKQKRLALQAWKKYFIKQAKPEKGTPYYQYYCDLQTLEKNKGKRWSDNWLHRKILQWRGKLISEQEYIAKKAAKRDVLKRDEEIFAELSKLSLLSSSHAAQNVMPAQAGIQSSRGLTAGSSKQSDKATVLQDFYNKKGAWFFNTRFTMTSFFLTAFNIIATLSCGIASYYATISFMSGITAATGFFVAANIAFVFPWVIAVTAAIGYFMMINNFITDFLQSDFWESCKEKISKVYEHKKDESYVSTWGRRIAYSFFLLLSAGLVGFITLATAGTWFAMTRQACNIFPLVSRTVTNVISAVSFAATCVTQLLFNGGNTWDTAKEFFKFATQGKRWVRLFKSLGKPIAKAWREENCLQFFNPLRLAMRLVEGTMKIIIFFFHLVSIGLMSDQLGSVPPFITSLVNAIGEFFQDFTYVFDVKSHGKKQDSSVIPAQAGISSPTKEVHSHQHNHSHGNIADTLVLIVLAPVKALNALLHWTLGLLTEKGEKLTFIDTFKREFGMTYEKPLPKNFKPKHIIEALEARINVLQAAARDEGVAKEKIIVLQNMLKVAKSKNKKAKPEAETKKAIVDKIAAIKENSEKGKINLQTTRGLLFTRAKDPGTRTAILIEKIVSSP